MNLCRSINIIYVNKWNSWVCKSYYFILPSKTGIRTTQPIFHYFFRAVLFWIICWKFHKRCWIILSKICFNEIVWNSISIFNVILPKIPVSRFCYFRFWALIFIQIIMLTCRVLRVGWERLYKFHQAG